MILADHRSICAGFGVRRVHGTGMNGETMNFIVGSVALPLAPVSGLAWFFFWHHSGFSDMKCCSSVHMVLLGLLRMLRGMEKLRSCPVDDVDWRFDSSLQGFSC